MSFPATGVSGLGGYSPEITPHSLLVARVLSSYAAPVGQGYIEDDLMENDLKSFFRAFSNLGNWIMI